MRYPVEQRNQAGVASVLLGGLALLTCWMLLGVPLGIAALLTGDIARRRVSRGEATNPRMALAGMALGVLAIAAGLIAVGYYSWRDSQNPGWMQRCLDDPATNNC